MDVCVKEEILQAYFDRELPSGAMAKILKHLAGCAACAARAYEIEQALALIDNAFEVGLPEYVPTASLRARVEDGLAETSPKAVTISSTGLSFWQILYNSLVALLQSTELAPRHLRLAAAGVLVALVLGGGLGYWLWLPASQESNRKLVQQDGPNLPPQTGSDQKTAQGEPAKPADGGQRNQKRERRVGHLAHRTSPEPARLNPAMQIEPAISDFKQRKPLRRATLWDLETNLHLGQTQLLLRSFKNASIPEAEAAFDLSYEKQLSRELLSKNRLLRRSAENNVDFQAEELLNNIEPLLLDIANLPDHPSHDEVRSIKNLIQEQKILATMQLHSGKPAY